MSTSGKGWMYTPPSSGRGLFPTVVHTALRGGTGIEKWLGETAAVNSRTDTRGATKTGDGQCKEKDKMHLILAPKCCSGAHAVRPGKIRTHAPDQTSNPDS